MLTGPVDTGLRLRAFMSEKFWFLKRCSILERLGPAELAELEARARIKKFPGRSPVYLPSDAADAVLLLVTGRVKICGSSADGRESILAFIEPGELFGELAMFDDETRQEHAETTEPSTVVVLPRDALRQVMERHAEISLGVTKLIGLRRRRIERRLKYLLFRSNRDRMIHLLLELVEQYGEAEAEAEGIRLRIKLSHQELASIIGSTRETVTIVLGELQAEQMITVGRQRITIIDLKRLAQGVAADPPRLPPAEAKLRTIG